MKIKKLLLKAPLTASTFLLSYSQVVMAEESVNMLTAVEPEEVNDFVVVAPRREMKNENMCYYEFKDYPTNYIAHTLHPKADQVRIFILRDSFFVTTNDNDPPAVDYTMEVTTLSDNLCQLNNNTTTSNTCGMEFPGTYNTTSIPIKTHSQRHNNFLYEKLIFPRNEQYRRTIELTFRKQEDGFYNKIWIFESGKTALDPHCFTMLDD